MLDPQAVTQLPTVIAYENGCDGNQPAARIVTLTRVQLIGAEYQLEYASDPDLPLIPNAVLFGTAADDLQINTTASIPESSRNHWSIKDADLFKVLLKRQIGQRTKPKVFDLPDVPVNDNLVAVMMPFDAAFKPVYEALRSAIAEIGMICQRADDIWENDHVVQDVALLLSKAAVVVCDLSGRNANVFYETGIAHTLGRGVVLIAQSAGDVPFDVAAIRYIRYLPNGEGLAKLGDELKRRLATLKEQK
ncbi:MULTISPECIES: hypothetical protein [Acidithiobacillus]|uniref:hypothetical protein n=1 Tax=Acidithiobacillus TaxID=119977 RepID=UPI001A9A5C1D|nr:MULTISPECIES: hypothetical protein [Acidithiobacillus]